ncbi:MAG: flippase [Solirubrobacteraceae bacterium]
MSTSTAATATRQHAARDILIQIVARVANLGLGVFVTALLARTLGSSGYGEWSTLLVVLGLVGYFASFGMERAVVREVAAHPEQESEWFGAMMYLRLTLLAPVIVGSVLAVVLLHSSHRMLLAGLILVVTMPFDGVSVMQLVFQVRLKNLVPMLVLTLRSVLWGGAVAIVYWARPGGAMVDLAIGMAITNTVGALVQTLAALRVLGRFPRPSREHLQPLIKVGVPLGLSGVLIIAYARIDQLIVFQASGPRAAGLYGAVYGVLDQSHFVPISVLTTLTPVIAASWPHDRERMLSAVRFGAELLTVASLGALAFAIVAAGPVVRLVFGAQFSAAAPALPVLTGAFVLICFGYLNGNLLAVLGLQMRLLKIGLWALLVNLIGNLLLVPPFGFIAAAWMTLLTELVVWVLSLKVILTRLELGLASAIPPTRIGRTALAALVLGGALGLMRAVGVPLGGLAAAACVLYPLLLFALGAIESADIRLALDSARR